MRGADHRPVISAQYARGRGLFRKGEPRPEVTSGAGSREPSVELPHELLGAENAYAIRALPDVRWDIIGASRAP
jgi:hypothetical protein